MGLHPTGGFRVAQTADGRLAVFARGTDNTLQCLTQSIPGVWSDPWVNLGGVITTNPMVFPAPDGRLEVFARGADNSLWCCYQTKANGSSTDWKWLGLNGSITSEPAVFRNTDGRMEVAAADARRGTVTTYQKDKAVAWISQEHLWNQLGGNNVGDPAMIQADDGRLVVFVRGGNNHVYQKAQTGPSATSWWTDWEDKGGDLRSDPTALLDSKGLMHIFAVGANDVLSHLPQLVPNGTWGTWEDISLGGGPHTSRPSAVLDGNGDIDVFVRGHDTHLDHYSFNGGAWTRRHDTNSLAISGPMVGRNADGRLEVFYRQADSSLWHSYEFAARGPWTQHASLGGRIADI